MWEYNDVSRWITTFDSIPCLMLEIFTTRSGKEILSRSGEVCPNNNGAIGDVMTCPLTCNKALLASFISQLVSFVVSACWPLDHWLPALELSHGAGDDHLVIYFLPTSRWLPRRKLSTLEYINSSRPIVILNLSKQLLAQLSRCRGPETKAAEESADLRVADYNLANSTDHGRCVPREGSQ